jgi:glycosyltransferase involved in cell wall biosynthesis
MYPRIQQVFRAFRPEVLHTHLDALRYAVPTVMYYKPRSMVHTVHNIAKYEMEWYGRVLQHLAYRCGMVPVAVACEVARSVERVYHLGNCRVISNGVPTELYRTPKVARAEWRAIHGFHEQDVLFVCVGRLVSQKNHALLLRAFAQGPAADARARLVLVGTGPLGPRLHAETERLGLADRVRFLGRRTDIPDVLAAMDAFVLSSDFEGNPVSLMEAMSAGLPVISTAVGGVPELLQSGKEGFLVQPGDVLAIANAMVSLLHNPDARRSMGAAGSMRAQQNFDVATMVGAYEGFYESLNQRAC